MVGTGITIRPFDYKGRHYVSPFWVDTANGIDPGFFVYGRSLDEYAPRGIIKIYARPDCVSRKWPTWNKRVNPGWRTKREAQAFCDILNKG